MAVSEALTILRRDHPWPTEKPPFQVDPFDDFFLPENRKNLAKLLKGRKVNLVAEIGTLLGCSARFFLDHGAGYVVSFDTLQQSTYWQSDIHQVAFLNCWDYQDRLSLVVSDSVDGLHYLATLGLEPDLIYLDGDHTPDGVSRDIEAAVELFPAAILCGDDFCDAPDTLKAFFGERLFVDNLFWRAT